MQASINLLSAFLPIFSIYEVSMLSMRTPELMALPIDSRRCYCICWHSLFPYVPIALNPHRTVVTVALNLIQTITLSR